MVTTLSAPRLALGAAALLGLLVALPTQAAGVRLFASGFETCCQIGGTVSGLAGTGLVLHLQAGVISENRAISGNGLYDFTARVSSGTFYTVSIGTQPSGQTCVLVNATGTTGSTDVIDVDVNCGAMLNWDQGKWGDLWQ